MKNCTFEVSPESRGASYFSSPIRVATSEDEVRRFCNDQATLNSPLFPAVAMYARGKRALICADYVRKQQDEWRAAAASASRIFVVGVAPNEYDQHVWRALAVAKAPLFFADPSVAPIEAWSKTNRTRGKAWRIISRSFSEFVDVVPNYLSTQARK